MEEAVKEVNENFETSFTNGDNLFNLEETNSTEFKKTPSLVDKISSSDSSIQAEYNKYSSVQDIDEESGSKVESNIYTNTLIKTNSNSISKNNSIHRNQIKKRYTVNLSDFTESNQDEVVKKLPGTNTIINNTNEIKNNFVEIQPDKTNENPGKTRLDENIGSLSQT